MQVAGKIVVVTGAAGGIGRALAERFVAEGAAGVCLSDREAVADRLRELAERLGPRTLAVTADVAVEQQVRGLVARAEAELGPIDLFCSNAGVTSGHGLDATPQDWAAALSINLMAHVYAAQAVIPGMLERGGGYLLQTCSAAGLLLALGDAPYTVSKHAAVAYAEWLAATYGNQGLKVSALCPQGVRTPMLMEGLEQNHPSALSVKMAGEILEPEQVADAVIAGLAAERFLILPHAEVAQFQVWKAQDPDRWLAGVRRLMS